MLDEKLQEEVDALAGVAPGDLILVLAEQHQQARLVAQHGGRGLLLGRAGSEQSQAWLLGDIGAGPPDFPQLSTRRRGPSAGSAARKRLSPRPQRPFASPAPVSSAGKAGAAPIPMGSPWCSCCDSLRARTYAFLSSGRRKIFFLSIAVFREL